MSKALLTPRARRDLGDIWDDTLAQWDLAQAESYLRSLWSDIGRVTEHPDLGTDISNIRSGYRKFPSGFHVIFYRRTPAGITIVRILHQGMDFDRYVATPP